ADVVRGDEAGDAHAAGLALDLDLGDLRAGVSHVVGRRKIFVDSDSDRPARDETAQRNLLARVVAQAELRRAVFYLLRRTFENPPRFSAELFPQLAACAHDSMTGDVRHAARTRAAVARRRIGVGDDDAHLLDRHAHLLRGELAQYRVRARTLVDS